MHITAVRISGVRGFYDERSVALDLTRPDGTLAGFTVVAGRNGAGKTSFLRAMALALAGPTVSRGIVSDFSAWLSTGVSRAHVEVDIVTAPSEDLFEQHDDVDHSPSILTLGLDWRQRSRTARGRPPQPSLTTSGQIDEADLLTEGPWADNPQGWLVAGYGPFRRLEGGAAAAQRLMLGPFPVARLVSLFHEDASLVESVTWLIDQHLRRLERRAGASDLLSIVQRLLASGLLPEGYSVSSVDADGLWVSRGNQVFALKEMSDGYRTVVALVLDLLRQIYEAYGVLPVEEANGHVSITSSGIVLIDELDVHLHVTWQQHIGVWLKQHFPNLQFIVSSHSPYICQAADPRGLIRLPGPGESRSAYILSDESQQRVTLGGGDDAVVSELFGLDSPYSVQADRLRRQLTEIERAVLRGEATPSQVNEYRRLSEGLALPLIARVEDVLDARDDTL